MKNISKLNKIIMMGLATTFLVVTSCTHFNNKSPQPRDPASEIPLNQPWSYDPGPSPDTAMGKELIDIVASQPNMPGISMDIIGSQKFRPAFGPTLWRMLQNPNSVKILFIGQDGTHIAEAAGRTATAGFGGRAQDMAYHFGVSQSSAFMNTYAFTIKGQYSAFGVPVISEENGVKRVSYDSVVENSLWLVSQDNNSPMVKWRNRLIDWIIRNNKDSLKLVVLFGGAAQDAVGTFIESKGGKVGARYTAQELAAKKVKVPMFQNVSTGGNGEMPVALTKDNKDVFKATGFDVPYTELTLQLPRGDKTTPQYLAIEKRLKAAQAKLMEAKNYLSTNIETEYSRLAIPNGGLANSGIIHPAQIGGFDLAQITINGQKTISLKGLPLDDGSTIQNDILVAEFPHPTALSNNMATASERVGKSLELLKPMKAKGWQITPDPGMVNKFINDEPYKYGRVDIPLDFYDFGTPNNRMVSVSSASRMSRMANVIVIGTRDKATFDMTKLNAATKTPMPYGISADEFFTARPRGITDRYIFDRGPGERMARIMKENIDMKVIGQPKAGTTDSFNIKSHPEDVGDFGHYRGTFNRPEVVILADPDGVDDILTSRALTGTRGQYLQSMMNAIGVPTQYLVIKTVPFAMDGATATEWKTVLDQTANYRQAIFRAVLENPSVKMIITDGSYAAAEIKNINTQKIPVVNIQRVGLENNSGIDKALSDINKKKVFSKVQSTKYVASRMSNIPRSHLGYFSRVWEGTSGTRVFNATSPADRGIAYAIVAPQWSYYQKNIEQSAQERNDVRNLKSILVNQKLPLGGQTYQQYIGTQGQIQ